MITKEDLTRYDFNDLNVSIEVETNQNNCDLILRFFPIGSNKFIGGCYIRDNKNGAGVVKLLTVIPGSKIPLKNIHSASQKIMLKYGYKKRFYQRFKGGELIPFQSNLV